MHKVLLFLVEHSTTPFSLCTLDKSPSAGPYFLSANCCKTHKGNPIRSTHTGINTNTPTQNDIPSANKAADISTAFAATTL